MSTQQFRTDDRVWWWNTSTTQRRGVVVDLDGAVGVRVDDGAGVVYVNAKSLHRETGPAKAAS